MEETPQITEAKPVDTVKGIKENFIDNPNKTIDLMLLNYQREEYKKLIDEIEPEKLNLFAMFFVIVKKFPLIIKIIYSLIQLSERITMSETTTTTEDKKTTFLATVKVILGTIAMIAALFGHTIPAEIQTAVIGIAGAGYLLFSWLQGLFTKDKPATTTDTENK